MLSKIQAYWGVHGDWQDYTNLSECLRCLNNIMGSVILYCDTRFKNDIFHTVDKVPMQELEYESLSCGCMK